MKYTVCVDLLYLEIGPQGPIFADTDKIIEGMKLAKATGFDTVEFWDWANKDMERIYQAQKELGLNISSICAKDRGTLADPSTHENAIKGLEETIEVAKKLGCSKIIVTAREMPGFDREESHKNIVEGFKKLAPIAEAADMTLVLEPIWSPFPEFFRDSAEPFKVIEEVGSYHLKLLYDIFHYQLMEGNILNTIKNHIDQIGHIHVASAPNRTEITGGELNYSCILNEIKNLGYDGYIGLEYMPTMEKAESLRVCKAFLENA